MTCEPFEQVLEEQPMGSLVVECRAVGFKPWGLGEGEGE